MVYCWPQAGVSRKGIVGDIACTNAGLTMRRITYDYDIDVYEGYEASFSLVGYNAPVLRYYSVT